MQNTLYIVACPWYSVVGKLASAEAFLRSVVDGVNELGYWQPDFEALRDDLRATANPETLTCSDCGVEFTSYLYDLCPACVAKADADVKRTHIHRGL